jgi:hypothetical protein
MREAICKVERALFEYFRSRKRRVRQHLETLENGECEWDALSAFHGQ